uniref:Uncharacterized protein n=1 Tax=Oncorhynchus mykiss TaxID=8022 RepID=A0A8K9UDT3_ONCMY
MVPEVLLCSLNGIVACYVLLVQLFCHVLQPSLRDEFDVTRCACSLLATSQRSSGLPHSTAVGRLWWIYMQVRKYILYISVYIIHELQKIFIIYASFSTIGLYCYSLLLFFIRYWLLNYPSHGACGGQPCSLTEKFGVPGQRTQTSTLPLYCRTSLWTGVQHIEHVKSYAPHIHHVVLFLECRPL